MCAAQPTFEIGCCCCSHTNSHNQVRVTGQAPVTLELRNRNWYKRLAVVIGVSRRDVAYHIKGHPRPTEATAGTGSAPALAQEIAAYERTYQDLFAMLFLLTEKPASLLVLKHEDDTGMTGDGQKVLPARRTCCEIQQGH